MNSSLLLDKLVERGLLDPEDIKKAAARSKHQGKPVERLIVEDGLIDEKTVLETMADVFALPIRSLTPEMLHSKYGLSIPKPVMKNFCIYPLNLPVGEKEIAVATVDPFDVTAADTVRQITGLEMKPILVPRAEIELAIKGRLLNAEGLGLLVDQLPGGPEFEETSLDAVQNLLESDESSQSETDRPIILLVNSLLTEAIRQKASDIHIEPQERTFRVRYRLDGILKTVVELPKRVERACVSRLKIISGLDISESRRPQDGRTSVRTSRGKVDMRVSTVPSFHGEKVVLRLLDQGTATVDLEALGFFPEDLELIRGFFRSSHGMVLITGPTGSGKTSTLYAALRMLNQIATNIVTVEDPVEYQVGGITQVQVNVKAGVTFASALRSFLRQDPDIIMVGEIRDLETAEIAVQAAQTGHLVLSTLHTNEAPATLSRLVMMGLDPHMVAGSLLCVVAQRLVRKLCPKCRELSQITPEQSRLLSASVEKARPSQVYRAVGCADCFEQGYRGRTGIFEILPISSRIRQQVLIDSSEEAIWLAARADGLRTLLEDGIMKVERGITSLDEVLRVVTVKRGESHDSGSQSSEYFPPHRTTEPVSPGVSLAPSSPRYSGPSTFSTSIEDGERVLPSPRVKDAMTRKVMTLHPDTELSAMIEQLKEEKVLGAPVVDTHGKVLGVVSFSDLVDYAGEDRQILEGQEPTARDLMSKKIVSVSPDDTLQTASKLFWRHSIHRLLVLDHGRLVGVVTPMDLLLKADLS